MAGISLGPILIRWNGILIMLGVALGGIVATLESKRRGYDDPEIVLDLVLPLLVWGTIGARLWHVLAPPLSSVELGLTTRHYLTHPLDVVAVWIGGLGFFGALIGGGVALYVFCRKYGLNFAEWADILAPALALGQAIGRIGDYFNQQLYGPPTNLPWKIFISPAQRLTGYESVQFYHPLFAYESILCLLVFLLLRWLSRRYATTLQTGDLFWIYLFAFSLIRFSLEFVRLDIAVVSGVNINQAFAAVLALVSGVVLFQHFRYSRKL